MAVMKKMWSLTETSIAYVRDSAMREMLIPGAQHMITVLYVGNNPEPAREIRRMVQAEPGWSCETVTSAAEALNRLASRRYTVVITEYGLSDTDGCSFLERIRSAGNSVPVILVNGNTDEEIRNRVYGAGGQLLNSRAFLAASRSVMLKSAVLQAAGISVPAAEGREKRQDPFEPVLRSPVSHEQVRTTEISEDPLLAEIFSLAPDGISVVNPDMTILGVNNTVEGWFTRESPLAGKKCYEAYYGREEPCQVCPAREALRTGQATYAVMPRMGPEDDIRGWLDVSSFPVHDPDGHPTAVIECLTDITARKRIRKLISEERGILNDGPAVVITWRSIPGGEIASITTNVQERFGYLPADLTGGIIRFADLVHPEDVAGLMRDRERHRDVSPAYRTKPYRLRKQNGSYRWISEYITGTFRGKARNSPYRSFLVDITEYQEVTAQLRQNEGLFRTALGVAGLVPWMADLVTGQRSCIGPVQELFGFSGEEIDHLFAAYEQYMHPDDQSAIVRAFEDHLATRSPFFSEECRVRGKDGGWFWLEIRGTTIRDEHENPVTIIGTFRDITGSRSNRDASHAANKKLHLLGSVTRHDILNQVMVALGYLALLEEVAPPGSEYHEFCQQATEATKRIQRQITFTRDYQDLGANPPEWQLVSEVVHNAAGGCSGISVTVRTGNLELFADPLLERVFFNLFDNTVRHGEHATEIVIDFSDEGGTGILSVEDNGTGIPDEKKTLVFERGYGRDSGLGLFLVREILDITGLGIREIGTPGHGARFEITAPVGLYRFAGNPGL